MHALGRIFEFELRCERVKMFLQIFFQQAHNDHQRTAETLLHHGADVTLTDDRGLTPVDLAKTRKMKNTLREAWTEATQKNAQTELAPIRKTVGQGPRLAGRDESPKGRKPKGEVIFEVHIFSSFRNFSKDVL